jgi:hypothetical protein
MKSIILSMNSVNQNSIYKLDYLGSIPSYSLSLVQNISEVHNLEKRIGVTWYCLPRGRKRHWFSRNASLAVLCLITLYDAVLHIQGYAYDHGLTRLFGGFTAITIGTLWFKATYLVKRWLLPHSANASN